MTDSQITIGTVGSQSGAVPGLGATFEAATRAYVAYRNATGGVCGREVVLKPADDAGDNARNRSLMEEFSSQAIGVTIGPAAGGDGGAEVIKAQSIPAVGVAIGERLPEAPTFFDMHPPPPPGTVTGKYQYIKDNGGGKAAVVYIEQATKTARQHMDLMRAAGIDVVLDRSFQVQTLSYDSLARAVANSGATYMLFFHEFGASASMAQSMEDTGYELAFQEYLTAYATDFIDLAGSAAEGASHWLPGLPAEDGGSVPEHAAFLEWMQRAAPGTSLDSFTMVAWAAAKVFLDSLEALQDPITRDALVAQLQGTGVWDADGFYSPVDLTNRVGEGCWVAVIVDGGRWRRLTPADGFLC